MASSDFSTPEKRQRNVSVLKNTIKTQRKKIHNLQKSVGRLRKRIVSLKSLMSYLKEKSLITEMSESTIKVIILYNFVFSYTYPP